MLAAADQLGSTDCEHISDAFLAQPVNAISSLAYVIAAIVVLVRVYRHPDGHRVGAWVFGGFLALTSLGSLDFHGTHSPVAQWDHDVPIALLIVLCVAVPVVRLVRRVPALPGFTGRRLGYTIMLFLLGVACFFLGRSSATTCDPDSLLQWHAAWHLCTAAAFGVWVMVLYGGQRSYEDATLPAGMRFVKGQR